ncbi:MAG TPA: AAA family ATPase [Gemmatimonadaceae bacterium]|nr:AAA family ATPase [Gemmatimonadaceae bacterium]
MPLLRSLSCPSLPAAGGGFPFDVPAVRALGTLELDQPVTFLVGENGTGKSTVVEALALAAGVPTVGSEAAGEDPTLRAVRELAHRLRLVWNRRATRGFFLRAEDFFGFAKRVSAERAAMLRRLEELDGEYAERSTYAKGLAAGPVNASLHDMERRYGADLDARSHGEGFLRLFRSRLVPDALYVLDEPETPLSPQSQLAFLAMLHDMVGQRAQFVIATHSPILLAYPGAAIYSFDETPARRVPWDELEHVRLTRDFLSAPERFLRHLIA